VLGIEVVQAKTAFSAVTIVTIVTITVIIHPFGGC
jgi:hypothetical protein